jgi:glycosyltransferase involved in cell wall biosynthesis
MYCVEAKKETFMSTPLVSIVIPTFNRANLVGRAIHSALKQTIQDIEVIVCVDGSTDNTKEILDDICDSRLYVIYHPINVGMCLNMNSGLNAARGEYLLILSDDDWLELSCLEYLLMPWKKYQDISISYGQWWYHHQDAAVLQKSEASDIEAGFQYVKGYFSGLRRTILHGSLFRRMDVLRVGGIPEGYAQDTILTLKLAFEGNVAYVPYPVTNYKLQISSATHNLNVINLLRDRKTCLDICLALGKENAISADELGRLENHVRKKLATEAAISLIALGSSGVSKISVWARYKEIRPYLKFNVIYAMPMLLGAIVLPASFLKVLRKAARSMRYI